MSVDRDFARKRWADYQAACADLHEHDTEEEDTIQRLELAIADLKEMEIDVDNPPDWLKGIE